MDAAQHHLKGPGSHRLYESRGVNAQRRHSGPEGMSQVMETDCRGKTGLFQGCVRCRIHVGDYLARKCGVFAWRALQRLA
jgi:hypothetical protein